MKVIRNTTLSLALISSFACNSDSRNLSPTKVETNSIEANPAAFKDLTGLKLKNCDQLLRTMSKVTEVDFNTPKIKSSFEEMKGACPSSEKLDDLSPSNITVAVKLSMDFCGAYASKLEKAKVPKSLDYSKAPGEAFSNKAKDDLYTLFYNQLWNGDVRAGIPTFEEVKISSNDLLDDLFKDSSVKDSPMATKYIVQALCIPMLSSAPITTL